MDVNLLKSASEDQVNVMQMINKPSSSTEAYNNVVEVPIIDFKQGICHTTINVGAAAVNHLSDHYINEAKPSTISIAESSSLQIQGPPPTLSNMLSGSGGGGWRNVDSSSLSFATGSERWNSMAAMREMIFRMAVMQPIHIDPESVKPPKRKNVRISTDPQSVAARHRRERISEKIRILQRLVPGGTKMDTASMLDEAIHYLKFLKNQVQSLERAAASYRQPSSATSGIGLPVPAMYGGSYVPTPKKSFPNNSSQIYVEHHSDS